ncbi:pyocin knob domain-containing protein [Weissella cibaria]|uniref:pyocin knob domain-containing protein n=2 Tax=Weissella cibaria TaxID=137591 RepID=UPI003D35F617
MANKFTNFIFTTEGKDTITQVLAAKKVAADAQLSINTVYTFATKLSTSLVYTQISSLGPKQTKPVGTVTPQDNDTVEMRIQLDNADLTAGYNLQGVAIIGQYNGNSFVLGYINANETTNIPPYDGTQVQTVALDVSFAISDTNIVTINTQTAGMLTVDDYNAMVKLLETRLAPLATDSKVVHLIGNETISDIKRFRETIIGSVDGNAGTADYMNVHTISSDINLDSISRNGNYLSTSKTKTTSGKPNGTSEQYTLVVGGNIQLFNDMSTDALYLRNRIDSKTLTPWKKIVEDVDQTLNAKYNYAQLPTVNGSGVALQSDLAAESNSRSVADRDLKTSIALEAQTRSAADIAFGSSLAAEVAARSTADASATAAMTKEQAARSTADASITANLTTETSARSAADTNLQALYSGLNRNLNDEIGVRSAADNLLLGSTADLAAQIAKERDNRVFNDNSLASDIASNATKRDELFGSMAASTAKNSAAINSVNAATMHLSGNETISGDKTFTGNNKFTSAIDGALKTREATFTDFADVAKSPKDYAGVWNATAADNIQNGPYGTIDTTVMIEIQPSMWSDAGTIRITGLNSRRTVYTGIISGGAISKWISSDVDLSQIKVGGRNLFLNSRKLSDSYGVNSNATVTVEPFDSTTNMWHIVSAQGNGGLVGIYLSKYGDGKIPNNSDWSYSTDVKGTGKISLFGIEGSSNVKTRGVVGNNWSRATITGHVGELQKKTLVMYLDTANSPLDVYIKLPKLEVGNIATDWTQAPEDAPSNDAQLVHKTGNETVAGDKTFTGNINFSGNTNIVSATTRGQILDGYDLNGYKDPYKYVINGANNLVNYPSGASTYATLEVEKINDGTATQKVTDTNNKIFIRTLGCYPQAWTAWSELANDANVVHKTGSETITGQKNFKGTQSFENLSVSGTAKLPAGFDGGFVRYTGVFSDWNLLWEYQMSGNSATFLLSGTALKDVTASDPADILLTTITKYPVPKSTARGFIIDVTTGANFGSLRMYSDGRVAMNWNAANVAISGHYIEGSISFLIS